MVEVAATVCFRLARDEILLALNSLNAVEEREHNSLAGELLNDALDALQKYPERKRDWSRMKPARATH